MASRAAPTRRPRRPARRAPSPARLGARRVRILAACCLLSLGLVAARAAWVQVIEAPHLSTLVIGQQRHTDTLQADRGSLLDRTGQPLALSRPAVTVGATLKFVRNPGAYAEVLAPLLHVDRATLLARLSDRTHGFVYLARQREPGIKKRIAVALAADHLNTGAISFVPEPKRVYPQRLGLQLLGATDPDGNGLAGAEKSLDKLLHGTPGERIVLRDRDGQVVRVEHEQPAIPGKTVGLTLDRDIQSATEAVAQQTLVKWKANAVTIVALDPHTGGILSMASAPGIPAGGYSKATPDEQRLRAVTDGYEPGSTFKVVTIGAALQEGRVTPESRFTVPYSMSLFDRKIEDAELPQHREPVGLRHPRRVVERRHRHDRAHAPRRDGPEPLDQQARLRQGHRRRPARRVLRRRAAAQEVVGHEHPQLPDRRGRARDAAADGLAVRRDRRRRRLARAARHGHRQRRAAVGAEGPQAVRLHDRARALGDAAEGRHRRERHGHAGQGAGLHRRGQDGHHAEAARTACTTARRPATCRRSSGSCPPATRGP